ncbi:hypothetical protein RHGRI_001049 [Rhododendron griersonianum]|uniref:Protein misato homolog 1 n=1 Tax=Rhododendron griersonianum TaxID=479676 RepID=A0AAV6LJZ6_9ERIC|nr:hypothetical protein RHGRI_001049 [Rhododendron griersonianum]
MADIPGYVRACLQTGKLAFLAILVTGGIVLQILACALYDNWWPLLTAIMYVLLPMPLLFFAGSDTSSLFTESSSGWVDACKFLTGASSIGSIAIPAILKHAGVIGWGALGMQMGSYLIFVIAIPLVFCSLLISAFGMLLFPVCSPSILRCNAVSLPPTDHLVNFLIERVPVSYFCFLTANMREIVTIQVGDYANFVGSHFWNFQDELLGMADDPLGDVVFKNQCLNMDVLYRTGETPQGILTYTPRLLSVGLQGSLGSMSSHGTLYNEIPPVSSDVLTWTGNLSTQVSEPRKKNLYLQSLYEEEQEKFPVTGSNKSGRQDSQSDIQDKDLILSLENEVQCWTDFSKVHYHPQSLYELNGLWVDQEQFNNYGIGRDAFSEGMRGEEMNTRLRFFIEECDHIQGIQFVVDDSGGFSGVAAEFMENIADEYSNVPVLLYSVRGPRTNPSIRRQTLSQKLHDAVSFSTLASFCKLIVPVGLPVLGESKASRFLCIDNGKPYHTSAVYASALHSISLPFRMDPLGPADESCYVSGGVDMNGVIQMLAGQARQNIVATLDVAMPVPSLTGKHAELSLLGHLQPLTPETSEDVEDLQAVEAMTIHGAHASGGRRASVSEVKDAVQSAYNRMATRPRFSHLSVASCPLPIPLPFPSIFGNLVGQHGELLGTPNSSNLSRGSLDVHSIPMAARLRSSTAVLPFLENRLGNLHRFGIQQGSSGTELLRSWGFGKEEIEDAGETLSKMVTTLDPHSEVSSDSD